MIRALALALGLLVGMPQAAVAWWNPEWTQRKKITLDTSPSGADIREEVSALVVPVRLHTGNFVFADAKQDGADLRFVAADDKTPLPYHIERIDSINELAIVWVRVPRLSGSSRETFLWMYYGNPKASAGADPKATYEPTQIGVYHFAAEGLHQDATGYAHHALVKAGRAAATGFINGALALDGRAGMQIAAAQSLAFPAAGGVTISAWIKPGQGARVGTLFSVGSGQSILAVTLEGGRLAARWSGLGTPARAEAARAVEPGAWVHVAVTLSEKRLAVYVDGVESGAVAAKMADLTGPVEVGTGFEGEIDELQLSSVARNAGWIKAAYAAQAPQGRLVADAPAESADSGGGSSYMAILLGAVTLDGWVVIAILAVMAVVSVAVMLGKAMLIARTARANLAFRERFDALLDSSERPGGADEAKLAASSLYRLYSIGVGELERRFDAYERAGFARQLSPQALGAIKSTIDAGLVRENEKLNKQMVLLTIAISGGPFLGLLGTVVGVMITFAAIAAAGDVNVNAIAPGIAAALVATVAGLGVAIPALFGYNYLASRIKDLSNDAAVFADELVSRFAEKFAP